MNHCISHHSRFYSFILAIFAIISVNSCDLIDGENEIDISNESPFYLKINIEGSVIDVNHGLDYQVGNDLSYDNGCEVLFNECNSNDEKVYLAASFGPNSQNLVNLAFTNLALDYVDLNNPNLLEIANKLPVDINNSLLFSSGTMEEGITDGNVFIGTVDYKYTYIHDQKSWARFKITELKNEILNEVAVIGVRFEIDCILFDQAKNREIIVRNGEGYLPFHLIINN